MANLMAAADGNFNTAATWNTVENAQSSFANFTALTTSAVYSSAFTVANGSSIDGVMVALRTQTVIGAKTITLTFSNDGGATPTRTVTIDAADVFSQTSESQFENPRFVFFKFSSPYTGGASDTNCKVGLHCSSTNSIQAGRDGTAGNWFRYVRTTTASGAAPAATDVLIIPGEHTGAGAYTARTVTMNNTATTSFGNIFITTRASLIFGTSAATNYYLKTTGSIYISENGLLEIGNSSTRMPADSTATLDMANTGNGSGKIYLGSGATMTAYGADIAVPWTRLAATVNAAATSATTTDSTGWLSGDEIAFPSTASNATTQLEVKTLSGNASGTSISWTGGMSTKKLGNASATQPRGVAANLTRNVTIKGTSTSVRQDIEIGSKGATLVLDCIQLRYWASSTVNAGVFVQNSVSVPIGGITINKCVLRDLSGSMFWTVLAQITFTDNICWNMTAVLANNMQTANGLAKTFTGNFIAGGSSNNFSGLLFISNYDSDWTVTGNVFANCNQNAVDITVPNTSTNSTFQNNEIFGCTGGFDISTPVLRNFTINNLFVWHCAGDGLTLITNITGGSIGKVNINNCTLLGNTNGLRAVGPFIEPCEVYNTVIENTADTTTTVALMNPSNCHFIKCDIGHATTPTNYISISTTALYGANNLVFDYCRGGIDSNYQTPINTTDWKLNFVNHGQTNGNNFILHGHGGRIDPDNTTYRTAAPSEKLACSGTERVVGAKLRTGIRQFAVTAGADCTISVYVRENANYAGARARLIAKNNPALGINGDTVLATATASSDGAWELLTYTLTGHTFDGVLECYVDVDAYHSVASSEVNVDDWAVAA